MEFSVSRNDARSTSRGRPSPACAALYVNDGGEAEAKERGMIEAALKAAGGRAVLAMKALGVSRNTFYRNLKRYKLEALPGEERQRARAMAAGEVAL